MHLAVLYAEIIILIVLYCLLFWDKLNTHWLCSENELRRRFGMVRFGMARLGLAGKEQIRIRGEKKNLTIKVGETMRKRGERDDPSG